MTPSERAAVYASDPLVHAAAITAVATSLAKAAEWLHFFAVHTDPGQPYRANSWHGSGAIECAIDQLAIAREQLAKLP